MDFSVIGFVGRSSFIVMMNGALTYDSGPGFYEKLKERLTYEWMDGMAIWCGMDGRILPLLVSMS